MTWREAASTLQLVAEERIGAPRRRLMREAVARENQIASAAANAIPEAAT